jgi:hypothetical protein
MCGRIADDLWLYPHHPDSALPTDIKTKNITCGNAATVETMEIAPEGDSHSFHRRLEIRRTGLLALASVADSHIPKSATTDLFWDKRQKRATKGGRCRKRPDELLWAKDGRV